MRLANGIVLEKEVTFGELKFSALRREVRIQKEDGTLSEEIKERTYDLKSKGQGRMIQVSIPASVPLKNFDYNAHVELVNPVADTVATATFREQRWTGISSQMILYRQRIREILKKKLLKKSLLLKNKINRKNRKEKYAHETVAFFR